MKATQYTASRQSVVVDLPKSGSGPHQVVIRVKAYGIRKTDLIIHDGSFLVKLPLVNGHESAGVIDSVGSAVAGWEVGDRATADNTEPCSYREPCRGDKPPYCENFNSHGCNMPGDFAEYVPISHDKMLALSDELSFEEVTFTESTTCAVHGMGRIAPRFGDSILMSGAGPISIILAQLLCRAGASHMVIADPRAGKLDILRKYGFVDLVVMDKADLFKHIAEIKAIMPKGFDIVIDAIGAVLVFESCPHSVYVGNKIVAYGVCVADVKIPVSPYDIFSQEYTILGSFARTHCFGRALEYLESSAVQVKELTSHEPPLEDYGKGLDYITQKQARRVIIHP